MPWNPEDAEQHKKGLTDKQKRKWAAVANSALKRGSDEGSAVRQASAAAGSNPGKFAAVAKRKLKEKMNGQRKNGQRR